MKAGKKYKFNMANLNAYQLKFIFVHDLCNNAKNAYASHMAIGPQIYWSFDFLNGNKIERLYENVRCAQGVFQSWLDILVDNNVDFPEWFSRERFLALRKESDFNWEDRGSFVEFYKKFESEFTENIPEFQKIDDGGDYIC